MDNKNTGKVFVEIYETSSDGRVLIGDETLMVEKTEAHIEKATDLATDVANSLSAKINSMDSKPDEIQIKFGVKLASEGNVIFAKASVEANFEITLIWKRETIEQ